MISTFKSAVIALMCMILLTVTCFAEEATGSVPNSTMPAVSVSETDEMALYPEALVPETPEGMTAYNIDGFVYFIWNDWIEDKEVDYNPSYRRNVSDDDTEGVCIINYADLSDRDGLTPSGVIGGIILGLMMSAYEESTEVITEYTTFRGIEGILLTINDSNLMWLAQHRNAVVMVTFTDYSISTSEIRNLLLQVLGGSEKEIKSFE